MSDGKYSKNNLVAACKYVLYIDIEYALSLYFEIKWYLLLLHALKIDQTVLGRFLGRYTLTTPLKYQKVS